MPSITFFKFEDSDFLEHSTSLAFLFTRPVSIANKMAARTKTAAEQCNNHQGGHFEQLSRAYIFKLIDLEYKFVRKICMA